jgi:nucleotide-binding universal stress UspA family protein
MQRHAGRHMTQPPDNIKIAASERPRVNRLARGLQALLDAAERQPDGLRQSRRSVVKALFPHEAERITATLEGQRKPPRRPTLTSIAKQASKAAIPVARYEVKPDGTVVVVTGEPPAETSANEWDETLHRDKH